MAFSQLLPRLSLLACALAGLGGCVAVPLAQMAVSQMASNKSVCAGCASSSSGAGSFGDISKGVGDSFRKLTGATPDGQKVAGDMPTK